MLCSGFWSKASTLGVLRETACAEVYPSKVLLIKFPEKLTRLGEGDG